MAGVRPGGRVNRFDGKGWRTSGPSRQAAAPPAVPATEPPAPAGADPGTPETEAAAEGRSECPDCGREFAVNKDGTLRKHTCTVDAPAPQVTFDGGE